MPDQLDRMRLKYGFWIIMTGFGLVAFITLVSIFTWNEVTSVATVVGAVSSLVGTVVGAFLVFSSDLQGRSVRRLPGIAHKGWPKRPCPCYHPSPPRSCDQRWTD